MIYSKDNTGVLFLRRQKNQPNSPDYTGNIELGPDLLAHLVERQRQGQPLKFQVAGWNKRSKQGDAYLSLKTSEERPPAHSMANPLPNPREERYQQREQRRENSGYTSFKPAKPAPRPRNELDDDIPF